MTSWGWAWLVAIVVLSGALFAASATLSGCARPSVPSTLRITTVSVAIELDDAGRPTHCVESCDKDLTDKGEAPVLCWRKCS